MSRSASKAEEVPAGPHYAILHSETYWTDHGYPNQGGSEPYLRYEWFQDRAAWEAEIRRLSQDKSARSWRAIHVVPAKVDVMITVTVGPSGDQPAVQLPKDYLTERF